MLWAAGSDGTGNSCMKAKPAMWWWLMINVCLFYVMVVFGLATWGAYLCGVSDAKEEIIKNAVDEYLKSGVY